MISSALWLLIIIPLYLYLESKSYLKKVAIVNSYMCCIIFALSFSLVLMRGLSAVERQSSIRHTSKSIALQVPEDLYHDILFLAHGNMLIHGKGTQEDARGWSDFSCTNKYFNAIGKSWFPSYLKCKGEYTLFKQVMLIRKIAQTVAADALACGDISYIELGEEGWPKPNPHTSQTTQGLFLSYGTYPDALHTPWGLLRLYGSGGGKGDGLHRFGWTFLRHFALTFYTIPLPNSFLGDQVKYYAQSLDSEPQFLKISHRIALSTQEQLEAYKSKSVMIYGNISGYHTIFEVHSVDKISIKSPQYVESYSQSRSYKITHILWNVMCDMYAQENKPHNKNGKRKRETG